MLVSIINNWDMQTEWKQLCDNRIQTKEQWIKELADCIEWPVDLAVNYRLIVESATDMFNECVINKEFVKECLK